MGSTVVSEPALIRLTSPSDEELSASVAIRIAESAGNCIPCLQMRIGSRRWREKAPIPAGVGGSRLTRRLLAACLWDDATGQLRHAVRRKSNAS